MSAKKRFYKTVTVSDEDGGLAIRLDNRLVKSPAGRAALLPSAALADAVAAVAGREVLDLHGGAAAQTCHLVKRPAHQPAPNVLEGEQRAAPRLQATGRKATGRKVQGTRNQVR